MIDDVVLDELADSAASAPANSAGAGDPRPASHSCARSTTVTRVIVVLVAACAVMDFSVGPVFESLRTAGPKVIVAAYLFGLVGCILGQGNVLAAWLAWSEGPFLRRLARHWIAAVLLYGAGAIGVTIAALPHEARVACVMIGLAVPLVSLAAQFPLWVTRQWFGWRITHAMSEGEMTQEQPLTIRGLMLATLLVGVAVALARVAPSP